MPDERAGNGSERSYISNPDLRGPLLILDKGNTIKSVLGHIGDPATRVSHSLPQDK